MKQNDEIENLFESTFEDFSVEPPPSLKIAIDKKINFKRGFNNLWIYIPIIILLLSFVGFMFVNNPNPVNESNSSQLNASENSDKNEEEVFNSKYQSENKSKSNEKISEKRVNGNESIKNTDHRIGKSENNTLSRSDVDKKTNNSTANKQNSTKELTQKIEGNSISKTNSGTKNNFIKNINSKNKKNRPTTDRTLSSPDKEKSIAHTMDDANRSRSGNDSENRSGKSNDINLANTDDEKDDLENLIKKGSDDKIGENNLNPKDNSTNNLGNKADSIENKNDVSDNGNGNPTDSLPLSVTLTDTTKNKIENSSSTASWLLSARFGSSLASNSITNKDYKLSETSAFFINAEASYLFKNNFNITSGFQYNKITNGLQYSTTKYNYVEIGIDSLTIPNPNDTSGNPGDTTIYYTVYDSTLVDVIYNQTYSQFSICIPIYFGYNYEINDKWFIDINGGIILSYQQAKRISSDPQIPDPTIRSFGVRGCVRPQIRYQFNDKFGVSFSSNFGYDFVPTMKWSIISRTRIYSEFGIGIHYGF